MDVGASTSPGLDAAVHMTADPTDLSTPLQEIERKLTSYEAAVNANVGDEEIIAWLTLQRYCSLFLRWLHLGEQDPRMLETREAMTRARSFYGRKSYTTGILWTRFLSDLAIICIDRSGQEETTGVSIRQIRLLYSNIGTGSCKRLSASGIVPE